MNTSTPFFRNTWFKTCLLLLIILLSTDLITDAKASPRYDLAFFNNINSGGTIASNQTICFGEDPDELISINPASGGDASLPVEYLWMQSVPGFSGWDSIPGANGPNYDPPPLNQTTAFMRCARRMGFDNFTGESNVIQIEVLASPVVFITEAPSNGNAGDVLTFSASDYPLASYTWDFGDGTTADGQTVTHAYTFGGTYTVTVTTFDLFTGCSFSTTTEVFIIGPLPVELGYFYGESIDDKSVALFWYTEKEINNSFFEVLKSEDGEKFEVIGTIAGQGNSEEGTSYQFLDDIPFTGINYYQLKQVDYSGEFSFSPVTAVHVNKEGAEAFTLYPNPSSDHLNIRFRDTYEQEIIVSICDVNKKVVKQFFIPPHTLKSNFNITDVAPGVYSLNIHSRKIRASELFVKIGL